MLPVSQMEDHPNGVGDLNALVRANWETIDQWGNPANGLTASQATTTVTASAAIFTSDHVGATIEFASGETGVIQAGSLNATPATTCTVDTSQTVTPAVPFKVYKASETALTFLARALCKVAEAAKIADGILLQWNSSRNKFDMVDPFGAKPVSIPAGSFEPSSADAATYAVKEFSTNKTKLPGLEFSQSSTQEAMLAFMAPNSIKAGGAFKGRFMWYPQSGGSASQQCRLEASISCVGDGEDPDKAPTAFAGVSDTWSATERVQITDEFTLTDPAVAKLDLCNLRIRRDHDHGDDDLAAKVVVTHFLLSYVPDAFNE